MMKLVEPTRDNIARAAAAINSGLLVAMPTETVYGLAADIRQDEAIAKIFLAKGRPAENPLIVHVASMEQAEQLGAWDVLSLRVAEMFWPGPISIVVPKQDHVSEHVTGGRNSIAIRHPDHPVAQKLIELCGPVAAPSANRFMALSPSSAEQVSDIIASCCELILDGGPCQVGIESTVITTVREEVVILRPGQISRQMLEQSSGVSVRHASSAEKGQSPGNYPRHYAPRARVRILAHVGSQSGLVFGIPVMGQIQMSRSPGKYAAGLYNALWTLDQTGVEEILVESPPESEEWEAINDRLGKASS